MAETNRPLKLDNAFVRHICPARTYSLVMVSYYPRHIYWSNIIVCSTRDMDLNQELNQNTLCPGHIRERDIKNMLCFLIKFKVHNTILISVAEIHFSLFF